MLAILLQDAASRQQLDELTNDVVSMLSNLVTLERLLVLGLAVVLLICVKLLFNQREIARNQVRLAGLLEQMDAKRSPPGPPNAG